MPIPLIIDTDPGCDDAIALMLTASAAKFEIKGVTTVAGNSTIEHTTQNARYILNLIGRSDIKVHSGASKPLKRRLILGTVSGPSGLDNLDTSKASAALTDDH